MKEKLESWSETAFHTGLLLCHRWSILPCFLIRCWGVVRGTSSLLSPWPSYPLSCVHTVAETCLGRFPGWVLVVRSQHSVLPHCIHLFCLVPDGWSKLNNPPSVFIHVLFYNDEGQKHPKGTSMRGYYAAIKMVDFGGKKQWACIMTVKNDVWRIITWEIAHNVGDKRHHQHTQVVLILYVH